MYVSLSSAAVPEPLQGQELPDLFQHVCASSLSVSFSSARRYGRRCVEPNACRGVSCRLLHRLEAVADGFQPTEPVLVVGLRHFVLEGLVLTR